MKVYLIDLRAFDGDIELKVVDEETYNWVTSDHDGRPEGCTERFWIDQDVPESQKALMTNPVELTEGSWGNDRALWARPLPGYKVYIKLKDVLRAIQKHGDTLQGTYEGVLLLMACTGPSKDTKSAEILLSLVEKAKREKPLMNVLKTLEESIKETDIRKDLTDETILLMCLIVLDKKPGKARKLLDKALWNYDCLRW